MLFSKILKEIIIKIKTDLEKICLNAYSIRPNLLPTPYVTKNLLYQNFRLSDPAHDLLRKSGRGK